MQRCRKRRGVALIMVLVLIVMLALGAYTFTDLMTVQERATVMMGRRAKARAAVVSGVEYLKDYLALTPEEQIALGGHWDNANYFSDVVVTGDETASLRFAIVAVTQDSFGEPQGIRFGLEDLSTKLNINELASAGRYENQSDAGSDAAGGGESESEDGGGEEPGAGGNDDEGGDPGGGGGGGGRPDDEENGGPAEDEEEPSGDNNPDTSGDGAEDGELDELDEEDKRQLALLQLPMMTESIADAILDWIDEDSTPRPLGAEAEAYTFVEPPNGPITSLDELLLVQGVTQELLYGADRNHNGQIDESEQEAAAMLSDAGGSMTRGWSAYLTVTSKDVIPQVEEPVDINQDDLEMLFDDLTAAGFDEDFATFVIAYRQNGPYTIPEPPEDPNEEYEEPVVEDVDGRSVDFSKSGGTKISSVLDVLGSFVQATFEGEREPVVVASPFGDADLSGVLPDLMGGISAGETEGTGRINLNECASSVAYGIPDLEPVVMDSILGGQDPGQMSGDMNYMFPTWPLAQGMVTVDEMKAMLPFVSASGIIFRAQVVAYSEVPGMYARAEVVIDASDGMPQVVSWRDLTHLGRGFELETLSSMSAAQ